MAPLSRTLELHPVSRERTDTPDHHLRMAYDAALEHESPPQFRKLLERLRMGERAEEEPVKMRAGTQ